jgi:Ran GTPase-activating protein (RanGAP) involved in mRNA processing and transport
MLNPSPSPNTIPLSITLPVHPLSVAGSQPVFFMHLNIAFFDMIMYPAPRAQALFSLQVNPNICSVRFGRKMPSFAIRIIVSALLTLSRACHHHTGPFISELIFNDCKMSDRQLELLSTLICESNDLKKLTLAEGGISKKGMGALAAGIGKSQSMTALEIHSNELCREGVRSICDALGASKSLMSLSLIDCRRIAVLGMAGLAFEIGLNPTLRELNINLCWLGADDAARLAKALETNTNIVRLDISCNNIGDAGVASLSVTLSEHNSTITFLDISSNQFGASGAASIAKCLLANTGLQHLELSRNDLGDAGATHLSGAIRLNAILEKLNISAANIGDIGAVDIGDALIVNNQMRTLWFTENKMGAVGSQSLDRAARMSSSLDVIYFETNGH